MDNAIGGLHATLQFYTIHISRTILFFHFNVMAGCLIELHAIIKHLFGILTRRSVEGNDVGQSASIFRL